MSSFYSLSVRKPAVNLKALHTDAYSLLPSLSQAPLRKGTLDFSSLKNKVVVIVNVASACGKTPQYEQLQSLYSKYKSDGLEIVGFPSNQFGVCRASYFNLTTELPD